MTLLSMADRPPASREVYWYDIRVRNRRLRSVCKWLAQLGWLMPVIVGFSKYALDGGQELFPALYWAGGAYGAILLSMFILWLCIRKIPRQPREPAR